MTNVIKLPDVSSTYAAQTRDLRRQFNRIADGDALGAAGDISLPDLSESHIDQRLRRGFEAHDGDINTLLNNGRQGWSSLFQQLMELIMRLFTSSDDGTSGGGSGYVPAPYNGGGGVTTASTYASTNNGPPPPAVPGGGDWMRIARSQEGVTEISGAGNNSRVSDYHASTSLGRASDDIPWCSSFVNWAMEKAGYTGTNSAMAASWKSWGHGVNLSDARPGDIVVLDRGTADTSDDHVGFFVRSGNGTITLLGGNQSNQVKESTYSIAGAGISVRRPPSRG